MRGKLSLAESLRKRYLPLPTKNLYGGRMDVTPAMVTQETVAAEVRAWLGRRNRSGRSIARELGWTEPYLSRRLTGTVPFDVADLVAIADLLDVSVTAFFDSRMSVYVHSVPSNLTTNLTPDLGVTACQCEFPHERTVNPPPGSPGN